MNVVENATEGKSKARPAASRRRLATAAARRGIYRSISLNFWKWG
jgi:hypothetical protein